MELDTDAEALLLAQSDTVTSADDIDRCAEACAEAGAYVAQALEPDEGDQLLAGGGIAGQSPGQPRSTR